MTPRPILPRAPIIEALLDVEVRLPPRVGSEVFEAYAEALKTRYPQKSIRQEWVAEFRFEANAGEHAGVPARQPRQIGFLLRSPDNLQVVQCRVDGFSFSRLSPYITWEQMTSEARGLWDLYVATCGPREIVRISLRYINRIVLPLPFVSFGEYLRTAPEIAPNLPQALSHFLMQLVLPFPQFRAFATLVETLEAERDSALPLILDIDITRRERMRPDSEGIWTAFEDLRHAKNDVFFESLTPRALELFQ